MKKAILFLMFVLMLNVVNAVDTGNLTETDANFTIYMDNTGLMEFNYPGNKNVTWNATLGWAKINNGSVITTYNISPGEAWALYQDPTTCVMPYEDLTPTTNQQANLCYGLYPGLHDASANGSIYLNTNNIILNCNGAHLIGNLTPNSYAIRTKSFGSNITIQGCVLDNYYIGFNNFANFGIFKNNTVQNCSNRVIYNQNGRNGNIYNNNTFKNSLELYVYQSTVGTNITNNVFVNQNPSIVLSTGVSDTVIDENIFNEPNIISTKQIDISFTSFNLTIKNNVLRGNKSHFTYNIYIFNSTNVNILNNDLKYTQYSISVGGNNINILGNNLSDGDEGIIISHATNVLIQNNNLINISGDYDHYNLGMNLYDVFNLTINKNNLSKIFSTGILFRNISYIFITNNNFEFYSMLNKLNIGSHDDNSISAAIQGTEQYKTYSVRQDICDGNVPHNESSINNNLTCYQKDSSYNIYINNNTFDSNTQVFLYLQGVYNVTHDLSNYWYKKVQPIIGWADADEVYVSNNFNNITTLDYDTGLLTNEIVYGYDVANPRINVTYFLTNTKIKNNAFFNYIYNSTIYNLTPPYNDILNSSNRVILASNQNTYSITLNPNQQIEVGDFPVVLTVLNHSILHDKFNVSITLDDSMNATLHVSTSASFTTYMNFSDSAFSTSHELQATGLSPGTLYYYQVNGTNSVGGEFNTTIYSVTTATTYCGDNIFQATNDESVTEQCDASDLNSQTCLSVGFTKGTLTCDSSCQFITTDCRIKSQMCQNNLVPLSGMATWLGLLVTIICIAFVFILFTNNSINLKLEGDAFYATILIVISVGFLLGVGILILSNLC